jgi:uncharacterized protein HemY
VHIDSGDPDAALRLLESAPRRYEESSLFVSAQAAAQAYVQLGDTISAQQAFETARQAAGKEASDTATLALAKAAFSMGKDEEGAKLIAEAVKSDHENKTLQMLARKVLADTGRANLAEELIDGAVKHCMSIIAEANALMRSAKPDESLARWKRRWPACRRTPACCWRRSCTCCG